MPALYCPTYKILLVDLLGRIFDFTMNSEEGARHWIVLGNVGLGNERVSEMGMLSRLTPTLAVLNGWNYLTTCAARFLPFLFGSQRFTCPICDFHGPFTGAGRRAFARCPRCWALERHRLQKLALDKLRNEVQLSGFRCLQFAPDPITPILKSYCSEVITGDINPKRGSRRLDMCAIDFPDHSFDLVYASHVLEHIKNDYTALKEIKRILRPGGLAILPVPVTREATVEYEFPNPKEFDHVRAVGRDYFDRYKEIIGDVTLFKSSDFSNEYQPWIRDISQSAPIEEIVPVCVRSSPA